jgi:hypothetical protein
MPEKSGKIGRNTGITGPLKDLKNYLKYNPSAIPGRKLFKAGL